MPTDSDDAKRWPALDVRMRRVAELRPDPANARQHGEAQLARIVASIERYGFTAPLLVDVDGMVIAGHARLTAATRLGLDSVPVATARDWTPAMRKAYALADNRLAELSSWDDDALRSAIAELDSLGESLDTIGFDAADLERLLGTAVSESQFTEIATGPVGDRFWLSIRGPISRQAEFLSACKALDLTDIEVDVGSVEIE